MNKSKIVVVALAAAILASGGGLAGSVATASPAYAATQATKTPIDAPYGLQAIISNWGTTVAEISWFGPFDAGTVTSYTVILKQAGKADRIFKTADQSIVFTTDKELDENASYVVQVKANIVSWTGAKLTSSTASTTFKTLYKATTVKVSAPTQLKVTASNKSLQATWHDPSWDKVKTTVGYIRDYTVRIKRGNQVIRTTAGFYTVYYGTGLLTYNATGLEPNTTYTVEVTANAVSHSGGNKATSAPAKASVTTSKFPLTVATPKITVTELSSTSARATWTAPTTNGTIINYGVWLTEAGKDPVQVGYYGASTKTVKLPNLKPKTTYTVSVTAVTAKGGSTEINTGYSKLTTKAK